ncbi:MAG: hypothetical protein QOG65_2676 [Actinomycetota bacterium]|jgi:hypothetical protein|nr:hypothetical protein [Actinomycetota bacterium]
MLACVVVALGLGGFVGTASAATPPSNDLIRGATVVSALPFLRTVDTTGATTDANDAQVNQTCGAPATNNSVWYKFTAGARDTMLAVDTTGSTYSTGVIIATGAPGALTTQACGPVSARVATVSGRTYYILAFADIGSGGTLHISMHGPAPVPANDKIGHAAVVSALPYRATLDTTAATTDAVDAQANATCGAPATGNSVWYKFTAGPNDRNIFVDASFSDFNAGVLIAKGTPGALTTVACSLFFVTAKATPGTTYYIMVFDAFGGGGGTLRLNIGDAPNITLNVGERARIDTHGVVHLTGEYSCTGARSLHIYGSLIEIVGNTVPVGNFDTLGVPAPICNGGLHLWTGLVLPTRLPFAPGKAALFIKAFGCGDIACTLIGQTRVVELIRGGAGTSSSTPNGSVSTRTVRRSSVRAYGNALHAATATWGH